jgi:seryl-tRNA synthetase
MKKILFLLTLLPFLALSQKEEKQKLKYDTLTKILTRERTIIVSEVIDTARLYSEDTRLTTEIEALQARRDSVRAQIKTARKLMTGKKGNNNNRAAEMPPSPAATVPTPATPKPKTKAKKQ